MYSEKTISYMMWDIDKSDGPVYLSLPPSVLGEFYAEVTPL